jgi:hypothetical protein
MTKRLLLSITVVAFLATSAPAATIYFQSGNGYDLDEDGAADPYQEDQLIRFVPYDNKLVPNTPSAEDFDAIMNWQGYTPRSVAATIGPEDLNGWDMNDFSASLNPVRPVFNFVSSSIYGADGASSLFGIPFFVPDFTEHSADLYFDYMVDNFLGFDATVDLTDDYDESVQGLWLNGQPIAGTINYDPDNERFASGIGGSGISADVTSYLNRGETNYLYMLVTDRAPASGLAFVGLIQTHNPEPATLAIWGALGTIGLVVGVRRRRRR